MRGPLFLSCLLAVVLVATRLTLQPSTLEKIRSETLHDYALTMYFDADNDDISVKTYLPINNVRQEIVSESILSGSLSFDDNETEDGRTGGWTGSGAKQIRYHALLATKEVLFALDPDLPITPDVSEEIAPWLKGTPAVPVHHREISQLWETIKPARRTELIPTLTAIYDYTYNEIEGAPFKGFTDALTALRLRQASCNGKSRLFVALARSNGIPARLVGGVILNNGSKRTSHQWVEVYAQNHWVPFDPTNGHFATLPANYLQLYIGDQSLFTHTSDINFDYLFDIRKEYLSSALFRFDEATPSISTVNAAQLLAFTGLNEKTIGIFLLFPFGTLVIAFLRNVIGLKSFGTFMPMLVAAACVFTGLVAGLLTFSGVVLFAFAGHTYFDRHNLLKIPRLAAIITLCTGLFLVLLWLLGGRSSLQFGMLALFPVIIISFLAERIHQMASDHDWQTLMLSAVGVVVCTSACYIAFSSVLLQSLFALMPELLLLVLALQIYIGRWSGMRFSEYFRFRHINSDGSVLSINSRNRDFVNELNERKLLDLAADKLRTKAVLHAAKLPVAETISTCASHRQLEDFIADFRHSPSFVIKPNRGSQGNGILVIDHREDETYVTAGGRRLSEDDLIQHTAEILSGSFSQDGRSDSAYIEPLLVQDKSLNDLANFGLADIRIIIFNTRAVGAMLRLPTKASDGKANLHQGAVGISIDVADGTSRNASLKGKQIETHPDTGCSLIGFTIPEWLEIMKIAHKCAHTIPLGYIGIDICIDEVQGPLVLEVNGRPGLEIQNVQQEGLRNELGIATQAS